MLKVTGNFMHFIFGAKGTSLIDVFFSDGNQAILTCLVPLFLKFGYIEAQNVDYI